jgi:hypothetical protein
MVLPHAHAVMRTFYAAFELAANFERLLCWRNVRMSGLCKVEMSGSMVQTTS